MIGQGKFLLEFLLQKRGNFFFIWKNVILWKFIIFFQILFFKNNFRWLMIIHRWLIHGKMAGKPKNFTFMYSVCSFQLLFFITKKPESNLLQIYFIKTLFLIFFYENQVSNFDFVSLDFRKVKMSFAQKLLDGKVFGRALHGGQRVTRKTLNSLVGKEKVQNSEHF